MQLQWNINCLELKAVFVRDYHVLIQTDNTVVLSYINHKGGIRSHQLQRRFLLWAERNNGFVHIRREHALPAVLFAEECFLGR